jgi:acetyl esterase/lipase
MIKLWDKQTPAYQSEFGQEVPSLTPYILNSEKPHAAMIVCPGGGYYGKAPHEGEPVALWLNRIGLSAFVLDYRVFPYHHPVPMLDALRAIRTVRFHCTRWNIDPHKIGILGFSAGGHVASTAATHFDPGNPDAFDLIDRVSSRPDALVLCYPVITLKEFRHDGSRVALIGENPPEELVHSLSNETQVTSSTPPTFLWHTANDDGVPVENSLLFANSLSQYKIPFDLHIFQDGPHGVGLAEDNPTLSVWTRLCENWLRSIGFTS